MPPTRADYVQRIVNERTRQFDLPGRELDIDNKPNDWVAIAGRYLFEQTYRDASREDFEDSLVKAAAVILAALEHSAHMKDHFNVHSG